MGVIIGVDPHKGSHTAVAITGDEARLAKVKVRATRRLVDQLLEWAARFEKRTWAIESAGGLGYLLAQQLVNVGERVLDVPATLAARVRVLGTGRSNKNDPTRTLLRSQRCGRRVSSPSHALTMLGCCVCWRSAITSWAGLGTRPRAGSMPCSPSSCPAGSPTKSTPPAPSACSAV
jgi:hypothetical protein